MLSLLSNHPEMSESSKLQIVNSAAQAVIQASASISNISAPTTRPFNWPVTPDTSAQTQTQTQAPVQTSSTPNWGSNIIIEERANAMRQYCPVVTAPYCTGKLTAVNDSSGCVASFVCTPIVLTAPQNSVTPSMSGTSCTVGTATFADGQEFSSLNPALGQTMIYRVADFIVPTAIGLHIMCRNGTWTQESTGTTSNAPAPGIGVWPYTVKTGSGCVPTDPRSFAVCSGIYQ